MPRPPSTRMRWPSLIREVAVPVPTTAGSPYSRATIAAWLIEPPMSDTAPRDLLEDRRPGRVGDLADEDVALLQARDLLDRLHDARRAFDDAARGGEAADLVAVGSRRRRSARCPGSRG